MSHHMFRYRHDHDLVIPSREPYRDRVFFVKGGRVSFWFSAAIVCGIIATSVAPPALMQSGPMCYGQPRIRVIVSA